MTSTNKIDCDCSNQRAVPVRRAVLVLGMHRAGTSALARVLSLSGAELPAKVMPANEGNPKGYWEPQFIVDFNDEVLAYFGVEWSDPFASTQIPAAGIIPERFYKRAVQLIGSEYDDAELFVLKDPRCTLLAEFWFEVLNRCGVQPCPVVMMRPYLEVADSLRRRDVTSLANATFIYVAYAARCIEFDKHHATTFVTFGQLLDDWRTTVDRIAAEQGFEWPRSGAAVAAQVDGFLVPQPDRAIKANLPDVLKERADRLWSWIDGRARGESVEGVDDVLDELDRYGTLFAPVIVERTLRAAQQESRIDDLRATESKLHGMFEESQATLRATVKERDALVKEHDALESKLHGMFEESQATLRATVNERDALVKEHDALVQERDVLLDREQDLQQKLDHASMRADALEGDLEHTRAYLNQVLASHSWLITRPIRGVTRLGRGMASRLVRAMPGRRRLPRLSARTQTAVPAVDGEGDITRHQGLAAFLDAEFGKAAVGDVIARIKRFELPLDHADVRSATRTSCSEQQAVELAKALADKAVPSRLDARSPLVSIIVPVYNQIRFTLACLDSLLSHRTRCSFEVLIGDDCSTDATAAALAASIPGVRHVRHETNLGFVRNCNATAAHAKGQHVVFLNNDTLVLPGWLDELIGTLERDERIGLVGSKLVYPDGRLQECGAIVWNDGSAWNLGRFDDPRKPEYCYLRDTDYVSGASIALRSALWRKLGGFDELFVPAYAEDADLAFRVRAEGLRTVVQPLSQILHFEGVTSGTDTSQGAKVHQVENLKKLHERWREQICMHRRNADRPDLEKERGIKRRALFVDHVTPTPNADAGSVVIGEVMAAFRGFGYKITFIPEDNFAHMRADTAALQRLGVETIYHPSYSCMANFLAERHDPFDVIFMHRYKVAEAHLRDFRKRFPRARIIFLNADIYFLRERREAELAGDRAALMAAEKTKAKELAVVQSADCTLVHSDFELGILEKACPDAMVRLFPLIQDPVAAPAPLDGRDGVCFVGGYRHPPNIDAIVWFTDEVWPQIIQVMPSAKLYIVGSHAPEQVVALGSRTGVEFVGFVEDLEAFLAQRRVAVAPLRYGAGAKGKVATSLADGLPSVCTPVAVEGMRLTDGLNVLVGQTPEALTRHVVELLQDDARWRQLANNGLAYAEEVTARCHARRRIGMLLEEFGVS